MVMTTVSYDALKRALAKDISIAELESALFDMGMELKDHEGDELSVEIKAERLDLLSIQGLARALRSFLGLSSQVPCYAAHSSDYVVNVTEAVKQVRPYTVCAVIKNLSLNEERIKEIIAVQEKLHDTLARGRLRGAIGMYPLDAITMPITYTADKPHNIRFIPLGETEHMHGLEILQRHETGREYAHLLEGKEFFPYFIDAAGEILSLPPIINSEKTGRITQDTQDIFIECSGFEKKLLNELLTNLVTLFADMGGEIYEMSIEYAKGTVEKTPLVAPIERIVHFSNFKKLIGIELSAQNVRELLKKMMFEVVDVQDDVWHVRAPPFRVDLWHEVDILDDIARAHGYNNLPTTTPDVVSDASQLPLSLLREELANVMVGLGFLETYTFALTSKQNQLSNMRIDENRISFVPIANGNETQTMMRVSLLPEQLNCLVHNRNRSLPQRIFEGAFVVLSDETVDVKSRNELHLCALITDKTVTFTQIRQVLDAVLRSRGVSVDVEPVDHPSFLKGRTGKVLLNGQPIGIIGEVHPQVLENYGLQTPVAAFEIKLEPLL